ncbi:Stp1/IreP family PP2C-type Ser/Thr phosphatase [Anaerosporobacter faecicola]|uniref:Stp1/IreP family PP2C-type Ser/Thr phosphatase n=1 Tax=Anaerosporobacter faecicola TaxID=2718714 RepID=UPI00143B48E7|nr:Stp1/IreP family PP2C-type Ser/Thr phosphatase [Anaerosporobacter faecicola]
MESFSITDIGMKRKMNQDFVFTEQNPVGSLPNLFIVADGMGGHKAGDFASRFSVEQVVTFIQNSKLTSPIRLFEEAIKNANTLLLNKAKEDPNLEGMGTTFVVATVIDQIMYVANVGDSRLYLIQDSIKQITRDHSLVEEMIKNGEINKSEARFHPNKNIITRAMGAGRDVVPDFFEVALKDDDIILMCSDGLTNMIDDQEIFDIVTSRRDKIKSAVRMLVEKANEYGGKDNITALVVKP